MCGFAGLWRVGPPRPGDEAPAALAQRMSATLRHRGPDDEGAWADPEAGIALGHRRLSILDLSSRGRQPMVSACGRWVLAYNGEVYNHAALRAELQREGIGFRGRSDTEVLLAAVARWGPREALRRCNGMLALALWDRRERELLLARDRVGKKPLYLGWAGGDLVFGSELKALAAHPRFAGEVDRGALTLLLRYAYVPAPYSIYRGALKLPPGTLRAIGAEEARAGRGAFDLGARAVDYGSACSIAARAAADPLPGGESEAVDALDGLLRDAVALRMEADVPLGAFLSGGIDSSTVVALMQAQSRRPIRTFTVGFRHGEHDEAPHARAVARHLGTEHTETVVTGAEALAVVPRLPELYDEPFADSSQIPTFLISAVARRHVTVALTGDGGDELFHGYRRYFRCERIWNAHRRVPRPLRLALGALLRPAAAASPRAGELVQELLAEDATALYHNRVSHCREPCSVVRGGAEPPTPFSAGAGPEPMPEIARQMMLLDLATYLPDDILVKVDRASMAVGLEARAPLLDPRVVELAWRLPTELKVRDGRGKWVLRQVLARYVPAELFERPKRGLGAPVGAWLRGPLREWGEALLEPRRLAREGWFEPRAVHRLWDRLQAGRRGLRVPVWTVLMFQAWLERQAPRAAASPVAACPAESAG